MVVSYNKQQKPGYAGYRVDVRRKKRFYKGLGGYWKLLVRSDFQKACNNNRKNTAKGFDADGRLSKITYDK